MHIPKSKLWNKPPPIAQSALSFYTTATTHRKVVCCSYEGCFYRNATQKSWHPCSPSLLKFTKRIDALLLKMWVYKRILVPSSPTSSSKNTLLYVIQVIKSRFICCCSFRSFAKVALVSKSLQKTTNCLRFDSNMRPWWGAKLHITQDPRRALSGRTLATEKRDRPREGHSQLQGSKNFAKT